MICELPKIIKALVRKAKQGDVQGAKVLLDRCIPAQKAVSHTHNTKDINITINGKPAGPLISPAAGETIEGEISEEVIPLVKKH